MVSSVYIWLVAPARRDPATAPSPLSNELSDSLLVFLNSDLCLHIDIYICSQYSEKDGILYEQPLLNGCW